MGVQGTVLAMAGLTLAVAWAQVQHQHHPPRSADEYAKVLEDPSRDAWQKPHEVVMSLGLRRGMVVADIGAGSGYFSRRFARHGAEVLAVDIDPKLLERAAKEAPPNMKTVAATADDPKLPAKGVDLVFFCDVVHHIENRPAYFRKVKEALRPGSGRVVVIDFHKRELPVGPPPSMKIDADAMIAEWKAAGFELAGQERFLPHQYYLTFQPRAE